MSAFKSTFLSLMHIKLELCSFVLSAVSVEYWRLKDTTRSLFFQWVSMCLEQILKKVAVSYCKNFNFKYMIVIQPNPVCDIRNGQISNNQKMSMHFVISIFIVCGGIHHSHNSFDFPSSTKRKFKESWYVGIPAFWYSWYSWKSSSDFALKEFVVTKKMLDHCTFRNYITKFQHNTYIFLWAASWWNVKQFHKYCFI